MTWRPTGATMQLHLALQRVRLNGTGWHRREFFAKRAGLDPDACIYGMRDLVLYGWAESCRKSRRKNGKRQNWREYRGKPPSELPKHGGACDTCGGLLGGRVAVCEQCLPGDIAEPQPFPQGSEMKIRLLAERYVQGTPLWIEDLPAEKHEVPL